MESGCGEFRGGAYRHHLKNSVNQCVSGSRIDVPDKEQGDGDQNHYRHETGKRAHFGIPQIGARSPAYDGEVQGKIYRRDQHEADRDQGNRGTVENPRLASWVENSPMATVEKAWPTASKNVIPAAQ